MAKPTHPVRQSGAQRPAQPQQDGITWRLHLSVGGHRDVVRPVDWTPEPWVVTEVGLINAAHIVSTERLG